MYMTFKWHYCRFELDDIQRVELHVGHGGMRDRMHKKEAKGCGTPFRNYAFRIKTVLSCLSFFTSPDLTDTVPSGSKTNRVLCRM